MLNKFKLLIVVSAFTHTQVSASDCPPTQLTWGTNNLCSVLSTFVADGDSRTLISPPRKEAGKIVGVGTATFRCEVGTFKQVSATCDGGTDAYASTRATTLPTPQNVALPKIGSDADLAPYKTGTISKASTVTQLTNEVGTWESQLSKDMKAQEARLVAYTDTKTTEAVNTSRSYTDTKSSQTLASANSYTNTKSAETLASANSYANTRASQALASANSYTDTKANQTLASANSYTDSKATATLNSANSYTNAKSTETLNSANSYTNTKSTQTLNSANAYTDSKAVATLNSANTYTNNSSATMLANSKTYTDSKSASTLTAANNYTDQEVANIQQSTTPVGEDKTPWWERFKGQTVTIAPNKTAPEGQFCLYSSFRGSYCPNGEGDKYNGGVNWVAFTVSVSADGKTFVPRFPNSPSFSSGTYSGCSSQNPNGITIALSQADQYATQTFSGVCNAAADGYWNIILIPVYAIDSNGFRQWVGLKGKAYQGTQAAG
jgi:hypothetical protein